MSDRLAEIEARLGEPHGVLDRTTRRDLRDLLKFAHDVGVAVTFYRDEEQIPAIRAALANLEGGA